MVSRLGVNAECSQQRLVHVSCRRCHFQPVETAWIAQLASRQAFTKIEFVRPIARVPSNSRLSFVVLSQFNNNVAFFEHSQGAIDQKSRNDGWRSSGLNYWAKWD